MWMAVSYDDVGCGVSGHGSWVMGCAEVALWDVGFLGWACGMLDVRSLRRGCAMWGLWGGVVGQT